MHCLAGYLFNAAQYTNNSCRERSTCRSAVRSRVPVWVNRHKQIMQLYSARGPLLFGPMKNRSRSKSSYSLTCARSSAVTCTCEQVLHFASMNSRKCIVFWIWFAIAWTEMKMRALHYYYDNILCLCVKHFEWFFSRSNFFFLSSCGEVAWTHLGSMNCVVHRSMGTNEPTTSNFDQHLKQTRATLEARTRRARQLYLISHRGDQGTCINILLFTWTRPPAAYNAFHKLEGDSIINVINLRWA